MKPINALQPEQTHQWIKDVFEFYWCNAENTILMIEFHRTYDWEEYHTLMAAVYHYIDGRADEVGYINIFHHGMTIIQGSPLPHYQNMIARFNDPIIVMIDRTRNPFMVRFLAMLAEVLNRETHYAPDVETAYRMVEKLQVQRHIQQEAV